MGRWIFTSHASASDCYFDSDCYYGPGNTFDYSRITIDKRNQEEVNKEENITLQEIGVTFYNFCYLCAIVYLFKLFGRRAICLSLLHARFDIDMCVINIILFLVILRKY